MDYKEFSRCVECKGLFQNKDVIHIDGFGFYCKSCYDKNKEVFGVIIEFEKYEK